MTRGRSVELGDEQIAFLRRALELLAERVRGGPADPELAMLAPEPARTLVLIAAIESALADAQDVG